MENIFNFNNNFIYWEEVNNHTHYKDYFVPEILKETEKYKNNPNNSELNNYYKNTNCFTSYFIQNSEIKYNNFIINAIYPALDRMILKMNLRLPSKSMIDNIWYNLYSEGGYHNVHIHRGKDISGIYLLELNDKNNTVFHYMDGCVLFNSEFSTENIPEGSLILFPSNIPHEVKPCKKQKISISFNIKCFP
jgi:hypothetical protein